MLPFKKFALECVLTGIRSGIFAKRILIISVRSLAGSIYWLAKILLKHPILLLYKLHLKIRTRLSRLGTAVRNPFLYVVSSKTAITLLLFSFAGAVSFLQLSYRETPPDILNPKNILSRVIPQSDEEAVIEEEAASTAPDMQYTPLTAVRPSLEAADEDERDARILPGDIAVNTGALIKPILPTTETRVEKPAAIQVYTVQTGDTIGGIAAKFGLKSATILAANSLTLYSTLRIGQRLTILPRDGLVYRVRPGDTLGQIAHTFQTTADKIMALNALPSDRLAIGASLIIPDAVMPSSAVLAGNQAPKQTILGRIKNLIKPSPIKIPVAKISGMGMIWPTTARRITQYFSWRHSGVDIAGPITNRIYAAADGRVIIAGWQRGYGLTLLIDHGNGKKTRYGHASRLFVQKGEYVAQGETIAMVGSTGRSTGPHLHFEVLVGGRRVNPFSFIR